MKSTSFSRNEIYKMNIRFLDITKLNHFNEKNIEAYPVDAPYSGIGLFFIIDGQGNVESKDVTFSFEQKQFFFMKRNDPITIQTASTCECFFLSFTMNNRFLRFEFNEALTTSSNFLILYLNELLDEKTKADDDFCQLLTEIIIIKYLNQFTQNNLTKTKLKNSLKKIESTKAFIHDHYYENINLDRLADASAINKYYLVHIFKENTGMSPIEYLIKYRVEQAQYLLAHSNLAIAEISQTVGFSSQSYFSKIFKRETAINPSKYRRMHDNNNQK